MRKRNRQDGLQGMELAEEAIQILRLAPANTWLTYYVGSLPFVLALLWFWGDMSQNAFAEGHAAAGALWLALTFIWMKTWQSVFARKVWAQAAGVVYVPSTFRRLCRTALVQVILQPSGLLLMPISHATFLTFGLVYAWYQNVTVIGDSDDGSVFGVARQAAKQTKYRPMQNHAIIWLLSPFMVAMAGFLRFVVLPVSQVASPSWSSGLLFVYITLYAVLLVPLCPVGTLTAVNIALVLYGVPSLFSSLTGIRLAIVEGGDMSNPTFFVICTSFAYLVLDPFVKAAYTLRCFYGESTSNAADLRAEFSVLKRALGQGATALVGLILAMALFGLGTVNAEGKPTATKPNIEQSDKAADAASQPRVESSELDKQIENVLQESDYTWRMHREGLKTKNETFISRFMDEVWKTIRRTINNIGDWLQRLRDRFTRHHAPDFSVGQPSLPHFASDPQLLMWFLAILVTGVLLAFAVRALLLRRRGRLTISAEPVAAPLPDIADESVGADALPEDGWLAMARDLADRGELRLAMRALFLAGLAHLARREFIRLAKYKSNFDYRGELLRRAHAEPAIMEVFTANVNTFESVWYGSHEATRDLVGEFDANQRRIMTLAQEG